MKKISLAILAQVAILAILLVCTAAFAQEPGDPHAILNKYFEASGGLDRLKAERTLYFEGALSTGGMQGAIKTWMEKPDRNRVEVQVGPLQITQGDNGELRWVLDTNGKVQTISKSDDVTLKRLDIRRKIAEYEYADPGSDVFIVSYGGTEDVAGKTCHIVEIANNINADRYIYYINADTFLLEKSIALEGEESADAYYGDFREVDGMLVAFYTKQVTHETGEIQEITLTRYETNPEVDRAMFDPPEQVREDYRFTSGSAAENIPFRFIDNHIFIPVAVNGTERLWALDTGASCSVIDKSFADELGIEAEGSMKGKASGGTVDVGFATMPPFEVKGISFDGQTVAVIDMNDLIRRLGIAIPGILGFDFLSRFVTKIDYAHELISFYDPDAFEYSGDGRVLDAHLQDGTFEVSATLDDRTSGIWLFDIGAGTSRLNTAQALRDAYDRKSGILGVSHGAGYEYRIKTVRCDSMQCAGYTLYEPPICFEYDTADMAADTTAAIDNLGELGNTLMRNFVIYVDYGREQVILEQGERFNQPWPEDHSGLSLAWTTDRDAIEVVYVSPGTPAEEAGFREGDIIRALNGNAVDPQSGISPIRKLLAMEPGTAYEIAAERAGSLSTLRLILEKLY